MSLQRNKRRQVGQVEGRRAAAWAEGRETRRNERGEANEHQSNAHDVRSVRCASGKAPARRCRILFQKSRPCSRRAVRRQRYRDLICSSQTARAPVHPAVAPRARPAVLACSTA
eukprot:5368867-Pleurochrysis_carterae.AAC.1